MARQSFALLKKGEYFRIEPDGPWHVVVRVTPGSAVVRQLYRPAVKDADGLVEPAHSGSVFTISNRSALYDRTMVDPRG